MCPSFRPKKAKVRSDKIKISRPYIFPDQELPDLCRRLDPKGIKSQSPWRGSIAKSSCENASGAHLPGWPGFAIWAGHVLTLIDAIWLRENENEGPLLFSPLRKGNPSCSGQCGASALGPQEKHITAPPRQGGGVDGGNGDPHARGQAMCQEEMSDMTRRKSHLPGDSMLRAPLPAVSDVLKVDIVMCMPGL